MYRETHCIDLDERVVSAAIDYRYLLSRGYSQKSSADIVSARYLLDRHERELLVRCIHRTDYLREVAGRRVSIERLRERSLAIDLMNILSTLTAAAAGECVYLCDDMFLRDIRGSRHVSIETGLLERLYGIIAETLASTGVREAVYVIDKSISHSGVMARGVSEATSRRGVASSYILAERADTTLIDMSRDHIVVSSDYVVIERSREVFDLAGYIVARDPIFRGARVINIAGLVPERVCIEI